MIDVLLLALSLLSAALVGYGLGWLGGESRGYANGHAAGEAAGWLAFRDGLRTRMREPDPWRPGPAYHRIMPEKLLYRPPAAVTAYPAADACTHES